LKDNICDFSLKNVTNGYPLNSRNERLANGQRTDGKGMFQPFKTVLSIVQTATEKCQTDAINVRTALENEKFPMDDASRSNG